MSCSDVTDIPSSAADSEAAPQIESSKYPQVSDGFAPSTATDQEIPSRGLRPGIYVPTLSFFTGEKEDVDKETIAQHAVRMADAGVAGIVTQGTNGEAAHLSRLERKVVTRTTRDALDAAGYRDLPIIVGCGAQSTRETIELCYEAQSAGGDFVIVLPPSYYPESSRNRDDSLRPYFLDVADASPIPMLLYNFPAVAGGVDLDSDLIVDLAQHHPNIVGCKLTCGNTGKLNRVASAVKAVTPHDPGAGAFMCLGGSADFITQALIGGGSGAVCGLANITPKVCVKLFELYKSGQLEEAVRLQAAVARGDWSVIQSGISGTKSLLQHFFGYGGLARRPLPRLTMQQSTMWADRMQELINLENRCS
jgi:dihydrodipicolinate synthase/N-acetylneuraminate lyase